MNKAYKPKITFMLDYGSNPLWSNDEFTIQKFGYHIDNLKDLGLSSNTIELSKLVVKLYWDRLNPIYQGLPSFWSGEIHLYFQEKVRELYDNIIVEISNEYEIENKEEIELFHTVDIQKIDIDLNKFLQNPNLYYKENGITIYNSDEDEKKNVALEYEKWKQIELEILKTR